MTVALKELDKNGRFPAVEVLVQRIDKTKRSRASQDSDSVSLLKNFVSYSLSSSMLIPVDSFSFSFKPEFEDKDATMDDLVREGDIVVVSVNGKTMMTGVVDAVGLSQGAEEVVSFYGRDMLGMFESQDAVSADMGPVFATTMTFQDVFNKLKIGTRSDTLRLQGVSKTTKGLFSTQPGESKLAALMRFIEPFNALVWTDPDGTIVIGRPSNQDDGDKFFADKKNRTSNVLDFETNRAAGRIPNGVLGVWSGAAQAVGVYITSVTNNPAERPDALRKAGHKITKSIVVSVPDPKSPEGLSDLNGLTQGNYVDNMIARMIARENVQEIDVRVVVPGHTNEKLAPYSADRVCHIYNDLVPLDEAMYCYQVEWSFSEGTGQTTGLHFCRRNTIVPGAVV